MIVYNNFEWDVREAATALTTHGVSFKEASTVLAGDQVTISEDPSSGQLRAIGRSSRGRMLVVRYQRGLRIRILGATLHMNGAAAVVAPNPVAVEPVPAEPAPQPVAAKPVPAKPAPQPVAAKPVPAEPAPQPAAAKPAPQPVAARPVETEAVAEAAAPDSQPPGTGWTAEAYGIYWEAYSAARQTAREQGKSPREAQRLGRKAGERAALGRTEPAPPKPSAASGTWRAAARAVKLVS
jgi:uncharacterized DUF497 family protein